MAEICEYCHEDGKGYVKGIDKQSRVYLYPTLGRWMLVILNGRNRIPRTVEINYCPMCGRRLNDDQS